MSMTSLTKAQILNLDIPGAAPIHCKFNPTHYSFAKQNTWTPSTAKGANLPRLEFGGGESATMNVDLFFDTFAEGIDVRVAYTDAIWGLMLIDDKLTNYTTQKGRPPRVRFQWGRAWSFDAVITSISQQFTLFLADGTPVQATLSVTFQQITDGFQHLTNSRDLPKTNPTSGGTRSSQLWTVRDGDTLGWIAYRTYGDAAQWRRIAQANNLERPRHLTLGMELELPDA